MVKTVSGLPMTVERLEWAALLLARRGDASPLEARDSSRAAEAWHAHVPIMSSNDNGKSSLDEGIFDQWFDDLVAPFVGTEQHLAEGFP
ncbi:hypothetical protein E4K66_13805 [Bradyrhizobium frederickii]|uniref:Uncharacterized protein n=1 Tax=Bradyrhizobium frederickii TaxID=2560054 RepID=A0A4Y9LAS5_9BRAD|nr:hypothetical protein [Bradyrhizobium frederickii]TFV39464.1 hypothetical protein E4K66_13805 [Bradyrhizobium frederickii]